MEGSCLSLIRGLGLAIAMSIFYSPTAIAQTTEMPRVIGDTEEVARLKIRAASLEFEIEYFEACPREKAIITWQSETPGTELPAGFEVILRANSINELVVPETGNMDHESFLAHLEGRGFLNVKLEQTIEPQKGCFSPGVWKTYFEGPSPGVGSAVCPNEEVKLKVRRFETGTGECLGIVVKGGLCVCNLGDNFEIE